MDQGADGARPRTCTIAGSRSRVLVIACGEFGRTPRVTYAPKNFSDQPGVGPADHWPAGPLAPSIAGGGGCGWGRWVGATTSKSEYPTHNPVTPAGPAGDRFIGNLGIDPTTDDRRFLGPGPISISARRKADRPS